MSESCSTCRYFDASTATYGKCRRYPVPTAALYLCGEYSASLPRVAEVAQAPDVTLLLAQKRHLEAELAESERLLGLANEEVRLREIEREGVREYLAGALTTIGVETDSFTFMGLVSTAAAMVSARLTAAERERDALRAEAAKNQALCNSWHLIADQAGAGTIGMPLARKLEALVAERDRLREDAALRSRHIRELLTAPLNPDGSKAVGE